MNDLQRRLGPRGLVVLGFPCNQFGHQVRRAGQTGVGVQPGLGAPAGARAAQPQALAAERRATRFCPGWVSGPPRDCDSSRNFWFEVRIFPLPSGPRVLVALPFLPQENAKNEEILNSLKYVRPGGGFEPNFTLFEKCEVNGAQAHPLFAFLREALPAPSDEATALMTDPKFITWSPVCRNDVAWNFEKFLVGPDGVPVRRYSRRFPTIDIEPDIEALLSQGPSRV